MNKGDLIDAIASSVDVPKKTVSVVLDGLLETVMGAVAIGDKVTLVGFGTFERRERQGRSGHNPATGERIHIPAATVPAFSAGKVFKEKVSR